ncbi:MAG TPA: hypothetical protein PLU50_01540 [Pseudobdellovibrionaceae bacterium]|nr:hypothetical protein [Pseudobdellovibrionaceae bacterium]
MKKVFVFLMGALAFQIQAQAIGTGDVYRVGNVKLMCAAANGLALSTKEADVKSPEKTTVETTVGQETAEYSASLNPYFFQWTWITLYPKNSKANDQGQGATSPTNKVTENLQIFLLGNAPDGVETSLNGTIGKAYSIPTGGGWHYPVGFIPDSAISCKVFWVNLLK